MIRARQPSVRALRSGAELAVVVALVLIALGLVVLVSINLGTSADIRKETQETHILSEMQIELTRIEEAVAGWQVDPVGRPHPSVDPIVAEAVVAFDVWVAELLRKIDEDELEEVDLLAGAFGQFVGAATSAPTSISQADVQNLIALDLAARAPLLEILEEENDHLVESVEADRRAEQLLRWGSPVLLFLAVLVLVFVLRLRDRGRQLVEQRKINEAQTQFIGSVSHELRTPLTSVVAYSHELRDRIEDFSPSEVKEFVHALTRESDEVAAIVDDLLVAARMETDHLVIRPEVLEIDQEIGHALDTIADPERIAVDAVGAVLADRGRLRQILRNLVSNARRYGGDEIRITGRVSGGEASIVVADSGPAIPVELRPHIFEPFVSLSSGERAAASVGLGLTVSHSLATLMGGSLTYSHDGAWSQLNLILPGAVVSNGSAKVQPPVPKNSTSR